MVVGQPGTSRGEAFGAAVVWKEAFFFFAQSVPTKSETMASGIGGGRIRSNKVNPKGRCKVENGCENQYNGDETLDDAGDFFDARVWRYSLLDPPPLPPLQ